MLKLKFAPDIFGERIVTDAAADDRVLKIGTSKIKFWLAPALELMTATHSFSGLMARGWAVAESARHSSCDGVI